MSFLISIITPTYNAESRIGETIESVQRQTYEDWELLIVDDASKDNTKNVIWEYAKNDSRIKIHSLAENSGSAVARNKAIKNAEGDFIAFLDSDDQWHPEKLQKQLNFMIKKGVTFSYTDYETINEEGKQIKAREGVPSKASYSRLLKSNVIGCLTVMIDRRSIPEIEMVNMRARQDYALWLKLTRDGNEAIGLQEVLAKYRVSPGSLSSNKLKMAKMNWKVYREIEKLNLAQSLWYFIHFAVSKFVKHLVINLKIKGR